MYNSRRSQRTTKEESVCDLSIAIRRVVFGCFLSLQSKEGKMFDLMKKGFMAGLGAVVLTRDKIEEATKRLMEEGKITPKEMDALTEDLVKSGEEQWQEVTSAISDNIKKGIGTFDVVSKEEFEKLEARIADLEKRLILLEGPVEPAKSEQPETE
jgi:polyhydroxyalkanoate synthesis regulator phasin